MLVWLAYYLFVCVVIVFNIYKITDPLFYIHLLAFFPMQLALIYFNIYVLLPRFLYARKYFLYALLLLLSIFAVANTNILLNVILAKHGSAIFAREAEYNFRNLTTSSLTLFYLLGLATGVKLSKEWVVNQQWIKEKEKQYLETELNFLKSQIQPHFFFNTLNNLYSLTLKKSDEAPEIVLKLSELMSYMLYESSAPKVPLDKEISYLENYLDLEKLRFGQRLQVIFDIEGRTEEVSIPPMILILFIENSFKHGVKNNIHNIKIEISLRVEGGFLFFLVQNPVVADEITSTNSGIGLKNVTRRLDLLYGNGYVLNIIEKDHKYIVSLKIPVC